MKRLFLLAADRLSIAGHEQHRQCQQGPQDHERSEIDMHDAPRFYLEFMHAGDQGFGAATYCVLQRLDLERDSGGVIRAGTALELGEIPRDASGGFATRKEAAMIASNTVGNESSTDTTETIPASQACDSN